MDQREELQDKFVLYRKLHGNGYGKVVGFGEHADCVIVQAIEAGEWGEKGIVNLTDITKVYKNKW